MHFLSTYDDDDYLSTPTTIKPPKNL